MWHLLQPRVVDVVLDYSSAGLGRPLGRALRCDGITLVNSLEAVDSEDDPVQVLVCSGCGQTHCEPGGWVSFRRLGHWVAWIPAFDRMEKSRGAAVEYHPPDYVRNRGVPLLEPGVQAVLKYEVPALFDVAGIREITAHEDEAVRLLQFQAPASALGSFPQDVAISRSRFLATNAGVLEPALTLLDRAVQRGFACRSSLRPMPADGELNPVEFIIDAPGYPTWSPIATTNDRHTAAAALTFWPAPAMRLPDA
jgi:hypothetical protein